jgi:general secretion pathway protein A
MNLDFYGLKEQPFSISPDPKFIWFSKTHAEAYNTLKYGITEDKGLLVLTGEVGTGKTLLIKYLEKNISIPTIIVTVPDPDMKTLEFYNYLAEELQIKVKIKSRGDFLIHFKKFLYDAYGTQNKVLIILDEAQRLNFKLLEQIRLLSNFEISKKKLLNIFLVGQNEFAEMLKDEKCKAVNQRIIVKHHLDPFSKDETALYIAHRLHIAGTDKPIFSPDAIDLIYAITDGYPRQINILCDNTLFYGWRSGLQFLDADAVKGRAEVLKLVKPLRYKKDEPIIEVSIPETDENTTHKSQTEKIIDHESQKDESASGQSMVEEQNEKNIMPLSKDLTLHKDKNKETKALTLGEITENQTYQSPFKIFRHAVIVVVVLSLGYMAFYFFNSSIKSDLRYSIEEIASQRKLGFTENEKHSVENDQDNKIETSKDLSTEQKTLSVLRGNEPQSKSGGFLAKSTAGEGREKTEKEIKQENLISALSNKESGVKEVRNKLSPEIKTKGYRTTDSLNQQILQNRRILIHFNNDSFELSESVLGILDIILNFAIMNQNAEIIVEGFTDSYGNYWYNQKLSLLRADAVKNYFVKQGLNPSRIKSKGRGSESPIGNNHSREGRRQNRRVEIKFAFANNLDKDIPY